MATSADYWEPEEDKTNPDDTEINDMLSGLTISPKNETWLSRDGASKLFEEVQCCQFCWNTIMEDIKVDNDLTIKRCPECDWYFGFDDLTDLDEINTFLADHMDKLCKCGNSDLTKFVLHQDGNSFKRQCCQCMSNTPVDYSEILQHLSESTVSDTDPIIKCPNCENRIKECFTQIFDGKDNNKKPIAARCLICKTEWILGDTEEEPFTPTCQCGNSKEDCFAVFRNNGYVLASKCLICERECLATDSDNLEQKCQGLSLKCHCGNENTELLVRQYIGNHIAMKCFVCDAEWLTEHFKTYSQECKPPGAGQGCLDGRPVGRTEVTDISVLRKGDHVAWWRSIGHQHHALVIEVKLKNKTIKVIHYTASDKNIIVKEEDLEITKQDGMLHRIDYKGDCYPPDVAIANARKMATEHKSYNILTRNCEHFVTECKTGRSTSKQVQRFGTVLGQTAAKSSATVPKLISTGFEMAMEKVTKLSVKEILKKIPSLLKSPRIVAGVGAVGIIAMEIGIAIHDISKCYEKYKNGDLSGEMFCDDVVDIVMQGVVASIAGGLSFLIPGFGVLLSPIIALIGRFVGHLLARFISFIRRRVQNHKWVK